MNRMSRLAKSMLMYDAIQPTEEVIEKIYAVTPEMVNQYAARTLQPESFSLGAHRRQGSPAHGGKRVPKAVGVQ